MRYIRAVWKKSREEKSKKNEFKKEKAEKVRLGKKTFHRGETVQS